MKNSFKVGLLVSTIFVACQTSRVDPDLVSKVEGTYKIDEVVANGRKLPQTEARLDIKRFGYRADRAYFTVYYKADRLVTPADTFNSITYKVDLKSVKDSIHFYSNYGTVKFASWENNIIDCKTFVEKLSDSDLRFRAIK